MSNSTSQTGTDGLREWMESACAEELARENPGRFFGEFLGWEPWSKQVEIAEAVRDALTGRGPKRVAVRSGNGVGKTAIAARTMLWVLRCWPESVVITTAPTTRQVDEVSWSIGQPQVLR